MKRFCIEHQAVQSYVQPSLEVVLVEVEVGFRESDSQQEPSPWDDM
jgi:hypothetical protein